MTGWETVIGLEIHVQLGTRTKMFCGCAYEYGAEPNTRVCPVCLGLPGALPVVNGAAVELAVTAALALGCTVHETSVFARKNYFYPDLPKGYQITQYARPMATGGRVSISSSGPSGADSDSGADADRRPGVRRVGVERVHLEEDTGKSVHGVGEGRTGVDFNRAGVPLIEVVTEPELRSPAEARAFLVALKRTLEYLGVSGCDMEKGSLRVDANLSVRPAGSSTLGTKTEVKNLNSFAGVEAALAHEADRQVGVLEAGGVVVRETRLWDAAAGETRPMRSKEESRDYRYFPEPDLPPLTLAAERIDALRQAMPELPADRERRLIDDYGLPAYDAAVLTAARPLADYFEATARAADDPKAASNWVMGAVMAWLNARGLGIGDFPVPPESLAELIRLVGEGTLSSSAGDTVLERMAETGRSAAGIVEAEALAQVSDDDALLQWVDQALAENPDEAARLADGETKLIGFFTGQVMRASGGTADPRRVSALLRERAKA